MKAIKWTISIFIIILSFIVTLVTIQSITAHQKWNPVGGPHSVYKPFFESTTPDVSCNIDNHKFTYVKQTYCDGVKGRNYWYSPDLVKDPIVIMTASLHGAGWIRTNFYGYIDSEFKGNHNFSTAYKSAPWFAAFVPYRGHVHDKEIEVEFTGELKNSTKTYEWKAKGMVELTPVYWKQKWGLNIGKSSGGFGLTGHWEDGKIQEYTPLPVEEPHDGFVEGSWEVKIKEEQLDVDKNGNRCWGYFENNTGFPAYGTYEAKVVETQPIKKVKWSIKKPGGELEEVETDDVNGGKTSSFSYSLDSTHGKYEVKAEVHFETNATTYKSSFTVY